MKKKLNEYLNENLANIDLTNIISGKEVLEENKSVSLPTNDIRTKAIITNKKLNESKEELLDTEDENQIESIKSRLYKLQDNLKHSIGDEIISINGAIAELNENIYHRVDEIDDDNLYLNIPDVLSDLDYAVKMSDYEKEAPEEEIVEGEKLVGAGNYEPPKKLVIEDEEAKKVLKDIFDITDLESLINFAEDKYGELSVEATNGALAYSRDEGEYIVSFKIDGDTVIITGSKFYPEDNLNESDDIDDEDEEPIPHEMDEFDAAQTFEELDKAIDIKADGDDDSAYEWKEIAKEYQDQCLVYLHDRAEVTNTDWKDEIAIEADFVRSAIEEINRARHLEEADNSFDGSDIIGCNYICQKGVYSGSDRSLIHPHQIVTITDYDKPYYGTDDDRIIKDEDLVNNFKKYFGPMYCVYSKKENMPVIKYNNKEEAESWIEDYDENNEDLYELKVEDSLLESKKLTEEETFDLILDIWNNIDMVDEKELGMDYSYHQLLKNVHDAEVFNYHSDYWGSADDYQNQAIELVADIEPYVDKVVEYSTDDGETYKVKLLGVLVDKQYNNHLKLLVEWLDDENNKDDNQINESEDSEDKYYLVTAFYDRGGPEDGPIIDDCSFVQKAKSEEDARKIARAENDEDIGIGDIRELTKDELEDYLKDLENDLNSPDVLVQLSNDEINRYKEKIEEIKAYLQKHNSDKLNEKEYYQLPDDLQAIVDGLSSDINDPMYDEGYEVPDELLQIANNPPVDMRIKDWMRIEAPFEYQLEDIPEDVTFEDLKDYYDKNGVISIKLIGNLDSDPINQIINKFADIFGIDNARDIELTEDIDTSMNGDMSRGMNWGLDNNGSEVHTEEIKDDPQMEIYEMLVNGKKDGMDKESNIAATKEAINDPTMDDYVEKKADEIYALLGSCKESDETSNLYVYSNAESTDKTNAESMIDAQYSKEAPNLTFKMHKSGGMWYVDFIGPKDDIINYLVDLEWYNKEEAEQLVRPYKLNESTGDTEEKKDTNKSVFYSYRPTGQTEGWIGKLWFHLNEDKYETIGLYYDSDTKEYKLLYGINVPDYIKKFVEDYGGYDKFLKDALEFVRNSGENNLAESYNMNESGELALNETTNKSNHLKEGSSYENDVRSINQGIASADEVLSILNDEGSIDPEILRDHLFTIEETLTRVLYYGLMMRSLIGKVNEIRGILNDEGSIDPDICIAKMTTIKNGLTTLLKGIQDNEKQINEEYDVDYKDWKDVAELRDEWENEVLSDWEQKDRYDNLSDKIQNEIVTKMKEQGLDPHSYEQVKEFTQGFNSDEFEDFINKYEESVTWQVYPLDGEEYPFWVIVEPSEDYYNDENHFPIAESDDYVSKKFLKAQATLPLDNYHSMGIIVKDDIVQYMYSNGDDVYESDIQYDEEGNPYFVDEDNYKWMISDFMKVDH